MNNHFRVYRANRFCGTFASRDEAMAFIMKEVNVYGDDFDEFEILDRSDSL